MRALSIEQATRDESPRSLGFFSRVPALWNLTRLGRSVLIVSIHGAIAIFCYALSVALMAQDRDAEWIAIVLRATLPYAALLAIAISLGTRLHWLSLRHAAVRDIIPIARAATAYSTFIAVLVLFRMPGLKTPVFIFVIDAAFLFIGWSSLHFSAPVWRTWSAAARKTGRRSLIVGAGDAGMSILKELSQSQTSACRPIGLVDDDPGKWGRTFHGVAVLGGIRKLVDIAKQTAAEEILICVPSATTSQLREILSASRRCNLPVRALPSLAELTAKTAQTSASLRDLGNPRIEDLVERTESLSDPAETRRIVGGKTVLVSGAGGSIGSELCRQIAAAGPRRLLLLDKSENGLFYSNLECSERMPREGLRPCLIDLLERDGIRRIISQEKPDVVFHAAAHKHVAMLELHPAEAIRNNVLGTKNIAEASVESGIQRFINISTDKAVDPRNFMGLSKKLTEFCVQDLARRNPQAPTRFSNVRFGNVAGSTGSVLRLFWEQIAKGGPVRVTDPRATRYFMSVAEAVQLILGAAELGSSGETFVLDMGDAVNIYDLARTMMLFAGVKPDVDMSIEFIGLREGEKLEEQLWESWERPGATKRNRIMGIREQDPRAQGILEEICAMESLIEAGDDESLIRLLGQIFPEFRRRAPIERAALSMSAAGSVEAA